MQKGFTKETMISYNTERGLKNYLLVIHPDEHISSKIMYEKELFYDQYKQDVAIKIKPQITIAQFMAREMMEETLIRWIQKICLLQKSFSVTIANFGSIPEHTVYLKIENVQPFRQLTNQLHILDSFFESNNCPPAYMEPIPRFTIAPNLPLYIYNKAVSDYANRSFHESFLVCKLMLYKLDDEAGCNRLVNTFTLPAHTRLFV